jgi:hypothetical protein
MNLESSHEAAIDNILDDKGQTIGKKQFIFVKNTDTVTKIQDQKKAAVGAGRKLRFGK